MEDGEAAVDEPEIVIEPKSKSKQTEIPLTYQKLVVPQKMRSVYWRAYGFPANEQGEILTRQKIICMYCQVSLAYNRNTSNLRMHLESRHPVQLKLLEGDGSLIKRPKKPWTSKSIGTSHDSSGTTTVQSHAVESPQKQSILKFTGSNEEFLEPMEHIEIVVPKFECDENLLISKSELDNHCNAVTAYIVTDLISPKLIDNDGFKRLLDHFCPGSSEICKKNIEEHIIPQCHSVLIESISNEIISAQHTLTITIEEWQKPDLGIKFATVCVVILKGSEYIESRTLSTFITFDDDLEIFLNKKIFDNFDQWGIKDKNKIEVFVIASANFCKYAEILKKQNITAIPCISYVLQTVADQVFNYIQETVSKCYKVEIELMEILNDDSAPFIHHKEVWTTTYCLLENIVEKKCEIQKSTDILNEFDFEIIQSVVNLLTPFSVVLETLIDEKIPSITMIKPFLNQMKLNHLKDSETDIEIVRSLKNLISEALFSNSQYSSVNIDNYLKRAAFLDPRFKTVNFCSDTELESLRFDVENIIEKHINEEKNGEDVTKSSAMKTSKVTGLGALFGGSATNVNENMNPNEKANLEVGLYNSERSVPLTICPMEWWGVMKAKCPNLHNLARNLICIPASSCPPHLLPTSKRVTYITQRTSLDLENLDKMLFLHCNQKVFSFKE